MKIQQTNSNELFEKIINLLNKARQEVVRSVNRTMVYTYFEIGRTIVESEQKGEQRAEYGKQILAELSSRLTKEFGKGFSVDNLENMRKFYLTYSLQINSEKYETVSRNLQNANNANFTQIPQTLSDELQNHVQLYDFNLSWSHYIKLMRIDNLQERRFYEIESFQNNWSLRELQRQYDSTLYERLSLSRDKFKYLTQNNIRYFSL